MKNRRLFLTSLATVLLVLLISSCISLKGMSPEEIKAFALKPENNRWDVETKMADKNVPYAEQSFFYCDFGYSIKDKIFSTYTKPLGTVAIIPVGTERLWARYEAGNKTSELEISFNGDRHIISMMASQEALQAPRLEAGQSYFLFDPLWESRSSGSQGFAIIILNDAGIAEYTRKMWDRNGGNSPSRDGWENYEEFHQFVTKVWQVRKEETRKQLSSKK